MHKGSFISSGLPHLLPRPLPYPWVIKGKSLKSRIAKEPMMSLSVEMTPPLTHPTPTHRKGCDVMHPRPMWFLCVQRNRWRMFCSYFHRLSSEDASGHLTVSCVWIRVLLTAPVPPDGFRTVIFSLCVREDEAQPVRSQDDFIPAETFPRVLLQLLKHRTILPINRRSLLLWRKVTMEQ